MKYLLIFAVTLGFSVSIANTKLMANQPHSDDIKKEAIISGTKITFPSKYLKGDRTIQVSLPPYYDIRTKNYPVIYTFDGDFMFEPLTAIVNHRASRDLMPESIIVAISTAEDRLAIALPLRRDPKDSVSSDEGTKAALDFLNKELVPYIEANYRTAPYKTLVGLSPTIGPVYRTFWDHPENFQDYIALAADLRYYILSGQQIADKMIETVADDTRPAKRIYIGRGGLDADAVPAIGDVYSYLIEKLEPLKGSKTKALVEVLEGEGHYGMVVPGLYNAFNFLYPFHEWGADYRKIRTSDDPYGDLKAFYDGVSEKYGYPVGPVIDGYGLSLSLSGTVRYLARRERYEDCIKLYDYALSFYPERPEIHAWLADIYAKSMNNEAAVESMKKAVMYAEAQNAPDLTWYKETLQGYIDAK